MESRTLHILGSLIAILAFSSIAPSAHAERAPFRERVKEWRESRAKDDGDGSIFASRLTCERMQSAIARKKDAYKKDLPGRPKPDFADVAYGEDPAQKLDVYSGNKSVLGEGQLSPIIFMVHGGAWCIGDKRTPDVVDNKVARWVPKGITFVSVNYRMLPAADPMTQADDVAAAFAYVQQHAVEWGADANHIIAIGHSAGAHLVSLLGAKGTPWLGAISLDSACMNVSEVMKGRHLPFYDDAFGTDPAYWDKASPLLELSEASRPWMSVCSTQRKESCPQADEYAEKAANLGNKVSTLKRDLEHGEINSLLGLEGPYTKAVEYFMGTLDPQFKRLLSN